MRSAGCIINDIADREFDKQVERTKNRPLASGELSIVQAGVLLMILLAASAMLATRLGEIVLMWALLSLIPVVIYPFMKRISWWPQLFLGLTFNWGALMGYSAVRGNVEWPAILLYIGGVFWTLGYDTIYAHQDKVDDAKIGVKSTALRLGNNKHIIGMFYGCAIIAWATAGWASQQTILFFCGLMLAAVQLGWQICKLDPNDTIFCRKIFKSNIWTGLLIFVSVLIGKL